jgi:histidinol-phosphate phosphatase family protein
MTTVAVDVVVPTLGRGSLTTLLARLDELGLPRERVHVVDDSGARAGPAAARNRGWRASRGEWVVFLDDDLRTLPEDVAGSQGQVRVPVPGDRRPSDWERSVAGLEGARWATADMAYRRSALVRAGGFDERFPHAFREDADLALRMLDAGYRLVRGTRTVLHPVPPADRWVSVRRERGNADDALMRALHGAGWHARAEAAVGRRPVHLVTTVAGGLALGAGALGRRRLALAAGLAWLAATSELAWRRIAPGPRTREEVATMLATSVVAPPAATYHWLRGVHRARRLLRRAPSRPQAVLFDRDGTLIVDVPYNGDPRHVVPAPSARRALDRLRAAGIPTAVISNQSGVARGLVTMEEVEAVNRRVEELLGPLGPWVVCPHGPGDACECRKPSPGLVYRAAEALGVPPDRCAVVGDIGADVEAATAAGARGVLVPSAKTRPEEAAAAREVAGDLDAAVDLLLGGAR